MGARGGRRARLPVGVARVVEVALALCASWLLAGCAASGAGPRAAAAPAPASFDDYRSQARQWIAERRAFAGPDADARERELDWNSPREWLPPGRPRGGVLLMHGLGDSPWSFVDLGAQLAGQGWLVRSVLLPGHGTRPADLLRVTLADWQRVVDQQAVLLGRDLARQAAGPGGSPGAEAPVWLGGFSTGANLALIHADAHPRIAGLLLFSPALETRNGLVWLAPLAAWARPWLAAPDEAVRPQISPVRYLNVPTNGFAQFYRSSVAARRQVAVARYPKPVLMVLAEHDSVLDTPALLATFQRRFPHPASRLVWYGGLPAGQAGGRADARVLARADRLPQQRISQFSHMGVLFAPANPLYGAQGSLRLCWNGQAPEDQARCQAGEPVWYSDWGYREPGKVHARLTFNPYFDWQGRVMAQVMDAASASGR